MAHFNLELLIFVHRVKLAKKKLQYTDFLLIKFYTILVIVFLRIYSNTQINAYEYVNLKYIPVIVVSPVSLKSF